MSTKGVFLTMSALFGTLAAMENFFLFLIITMIFFIFLLQRIKVEIKYIMLFLVIFSVFFIRAYLEIDSNQTHFLGSERNFILLFNEIGKINGDLLTIAVTDQKSKEPLLLRYKIKTENEKKLLQNELSPGMVCRVKGLLEKPPESSNPNAFNYKNYLLQNGIHWILEPEAFHINSCQNSPTPLTSIKRFRAEGIRYLEDYFPKETVPLAAALLFGSSDLISAETMDDYRDLGIVHLLAISGLHIAIVVAIFYQLLLRVGITRENCVLLLLLCLPLYGILTGASPSVNRSIMMTMILLICKRWGSAYHVSPLDGICVTFLIYVFISPYVIYNVGFQLSFLVTFTLLVSIPYILESIEQPISALLSTSFLSMLSSAPILLYFFYEFSVISLVVNLIYIPLFNIVILPLVLVCFILHLLFKGMIDPLLYLLNKIIIWTNTMTEIIAQLPFNQVVLGKPSVFILILYIVGLTFFFIRWEKQRKHSWHKYCLLFIPLFLFSCQFLLTTYSREGEVTILDVGQGDSIFINLPYGKGTYLIDTGGQLLFEREAWQMKKRPFEVGRDTVVPFLKSKGITTLDKLIITHGDSDHAGGAEAVLNELKVKELVLPDSYEKSELEEKLIKLATEKRIKIRFVQKGDQWKVENQSFTILSPNEGTSSNKNNSSIVLYTEMGGLRWLFTGDLEEEGEKRLIAEYPDLKIDVLKVGHHGSQTSSSDLFLDVLSPKLAIISAGKNNRFNHPHQDVLDALEKRKIKILRTDLSGAITYKFVKETGTFYVHCP